MFFSFHSNAQTTVDSLYSVITLDGNEYTGKLLKQDIKHITLETETLGVINIPKDQIKKMTPMRERPSTNSPYYTQSNPYPYRYFIGTSGYGLRKGEGYYKNTWVLFNQMSFGITDNFSMGAGIIPLFFFDGTASPFWITPKVSIPIQKDKVNLEIGGIYFNAIGEDAADAPFFSILYGSATLGSRDNNITLGIGYGANDEGLTDIPAFNFSAMLRISRRTYLITENYLFDSGLDGNVTFISFGGRSVSKGRISIDYSLILPLITDADAFIAIPFLSVGMPLGRS